MRVALAFPGCHRRAGVERVVWECARFLDTRGHTVTVFANEWEEAPGSHITYVRVPMLRRPYFLRGASFFRQCTRALHSATYEVLNTHGCVCPTGGVHWVQSVHHAWLERSRAMRPPLSPERLRQKVNPLHPILLGLERKHFRKGGYRKIIVTTEQVRQDLTRIFGLLEEDIVIIPNGFDPENFNPGRRRAHRKDARNALSLGETDIALLFVAHELERKGYRTILQALQLLHRPDLKVLVVGRADRQRAAVLAEAHGVSEQVIICGPTSDVAHFHAAADLFVLPTQYEAFCLAILEALGSGLPVITSAVPGAQDAIVEGENGSLIQDPNSGEQLALALQAYLDGQFREQISMQVSSTVEKYQWPRVLERYEQVLLEASA
ncbi:MAG: glycosyltransferase family 4 protein [Armatimonadota bacterium]